MDSRNKTKLMTIIKTLLTVQPQKEWTSSKIAEYINTHDYNINIEVNSSVIGQLIRTERKDRRSFLNDIEIEKIRGNKYKYKLKE